MVALLDHPLKPIFNCFGKSARGEGREDETRHEEYVARQNACEYDTTHCYDKLSSSLLRSLCAVFALSFPVQFRSSVPFRLAYHTLSKV
jgi:hypothetical protein